MSALKTPIQEGISLGLLCMEKITGFNSQHLSWFKRCYKGQLWQIQVLYNSWRSIL